MTSETQARQIIDQKLESAGWLVQDFKAINPGASACVAVYEYPFDKDAGRVAGVTRSAASCWKAV